ncbi:hypothetical protein DMH03_12645 [Amycolatopsis sp. WAC 01376]|uniref:hypothetical protein n=1 Tax=Amycolatopsis sp. WAC 01376 TaxID=2203195 RepID=UPI00100061A1|nr:hypothetical protein [Amycolatopsis sp. WAC 01376]RSM62897.1 hypothetical protein DMH03_12645 [Amycolatopsis sp. WAC 01376]
MNRVVIAFLVVVLAVLTASCAEQQGASQTTTGKSTSSAVTTSTRPPSSNPTPTSTIISTTQPSEYPKFVPKSKVDKRYTQYVTGDKMVMLAPGVYAEPSPDAVLGTLDDYSSYLGNCTAIKRYSETHPGGHTCW